MLIKFTRADFLMATVVPKDWYPTEIAAVSDPYVSSKGDSQNVDLTMRIIDGEFTGKERKKTFNSQAWGRFLPLIVAVEGKTQLTKEEEQKLSEADFDPKALVGKKIKAEWTVKQYEGRLVNEIENFAPLTMNTTAPF